MTIILLLIFIAICIAVSIGTHKKINNFLVACVVGGVIRKMANEDQDG